jgi:hypothetical protein
MTVSQAHGGRLPIYDQVADPVFILATPRSFSSVVCAMLGQHPQMYSLPETHLFGDDTMEGWWRRSAGATFQMGHGLLRAVAEVCFGDQTERTVILACAWLRRRRGDTSGMVFEELARTVSPLILIEKSPSVVYDVDAMHRIHHFFPQARFIHLVRHPRGYCRSVVRYVHTLSRPEYQRPGSTPTGEAPGWINDLAYFGYPEAVASSGARSDVVDPQGGWYVLNSNIITFLESVPRQQWTTLRGEVLLESPDQGLANLAEWLGLRTDSVAIEEMKHPERSPYARFGPPGTRLGNDILFLERPAMRPARGQRHSLRGRLEWRMDGYGFLPEVVELARRLGYD